jgi:hypothetical protein
MPKGRGVRFTVLVEDRALERFVRECLYHFGVHHREIRIVPFPAGRGSAKQWNDREYPIQVQAHRRRSTENIALVVGTDADDQTVQQRAQRLPEVLQQAGREARSPQERIGLLVPRWNIETWLLFLSGREVDEAANYKGQAREVDIKAAAQEFVRRFRQYVHDPGAESHLPSLVSALEETKRIQQALDRASS